MRFDALVKCFFVIAIQDGHRGLSEDRTCIHSGVHHVNSHAGDFDAVGQSISDAVGPGERRQKGRVGIDDPAIETADQVRIHDAHKTCEDDVIRRVGGDLFLKGAVPCGPVCVIRRADHEILDTGIGRPLDSSAGLVRPYGSDLDVEQIRLHCIQNGLKICPGTRDHDHYAHELNLTDMPGSVEI